MFWGLALALAAAAAAAALLSGVRFRVHYRRNETDDEIHAELTALFGLLRLRRTAAAVELKPWLKGFRLRLEQNRESDKIDVARRDMRQMAQTFHLLIQHMDNYRKFIADTLRHVRISELRWQTRLGTGDAAETGIACGAAWALKCAAAGAIARSVTFRTMPQFSVVPSFHAPRLQTELHLDARVRAFWLAYAFLMLLRRILRSHGGLKVWWKAMRKKKKH